MALRNKVDTILKYIEANTGKIAENTTIFNILEGDVLTQVYKKIDEQLSGESQKISKQRVPPINILSKVVDKQTSLYSEKPERETENAQDKELVKQYSEALELDTSGETVNESFNAYKYGVIEIYNDKDDSAIKTRVLPCNMFLPYGDDKKNPIKMTVMIKFMGSAEVGKPINGYVELADSSTRKRDRKTVNIYHLTSDDEFLAITSKGDIYAPDMEDNPEGVNPYGVIPYSYVSKSKFLLLPKTDTDTISMSVLIPLLMTEVNFGMMFLSNPILYGIDIDTENLQISPLTFWNVKSTDENDRTGSLNVLQPNMDIPKQTTWIKEQLAIWLETKNIKASHLIDMDGGSISSGIALIIREMDTTEDRNKQAKYFTAWERDFWYRLGKIHNVLAGANQISEKRRFTDNLKVVTSFGTQMPVEDKTAVENRVISKYQAGLLSLETALHELYPQWTDERIAEEIEKKGPALEIFETEEENAEVPTQDNA
jgi:hypothetical protein